MDSDDDEAAILAVEVEIEETKTAITKTEAAVEKVEEKLNEVHTQLQSPSLPADEKKHLREKEAQLLTEKKELREEKKQLREKEAQLREEKKQLRTERLRGIEERKEQLRAKKEEAEDYLKRALLVGPPSKASLKREQMDGAGVLLNNWRPTAAAAGLPPELIHPVFAKAVEFMAGGTEVDQATMDTAGKLCCIGGDIYVDEAQLNKAVRKLLKPYLEDDKAVAIRSGFAKGANPDWAIGNLTKKPSNLLLVYEGKTGIGSSGDPHFQGALYHLHFWRQRSESATFRNTCCPAFLLEVVGPHVRLSAMAWLDRVTIFPLTPLLNLLPAHPVTDCLLMPVARMLAALRTGVRELAAAHAALAALQQPAAAIELPLVPWPIGMNPRYDAAAAKQLAASNPTFYVPLTDRGDGRKGGGVRAVVVKLCRKYGLEAHRAWAALGLAPRVLRAEPLPGGWQLVEMVWLRVPKWRMLSELQDKALGEALGAVRKALKEAHRATGMVHGDARPPNCLVRRGAEGPGSWQVRFVDFEWAGRAREATYPACLNPDIPWPEGVGYGRPLRRRHDLQLLAACTAGHAAGDGHGASGRTAHEKGSGRVRTKEAPRRVGVKRGLEEDKNGSAPGEGVPSKKKRQHGQGRGVPA